MSLSYFLVLCPFMATGPMNCNCSANLLCRHCGHLVTSSSHIMRKKTFAALDAYNMTITNVSTLVQVLENTVRKLAQPPYAQLS